MILRKSSIALATFIAILIVILNNTFPSKAIEQTTFFDGFKGDLNKEWYKSDWPNPSPFGCIWDKDEVQNIISDDNGILNLNLNPNGEPKKCGQVKSRQEFTSGKFIAHMKPLDIPGTVSSFFLYTGDYKTLSHYEIDIEFIGGTKKLHTNYWIAGEEHPYDIDLSDKKFGIDPYSQFRRYGFEWRSNKIIWFTDDNAGNQINLREERVSLKAKLPIFMNNWNGDNKDSFPGHYDEDNRDGGTAQYDYVLVEKVED
jgi:endo-1,3-1,4-beta-glycanase ExoK